jgi:hypothetical protein
MGDCQITFGDIKAVENCPCDLCKKFRELKIGIPYSLNEQELNEECKRLAEVAEYWQKKYYEVVPPHQPSKLDDL